jgi:hypothetical protein
VIHVDLWWSFIAIDDHLVILKSLDHAESKNTTPVTKRLVLGFPEHTKRSFQLPKTCYLRTLLPQNEPVCGNGHVLITTCKLRRNYFFRLVRIYLCSAWRDESEYIHFDAYIRNFIKTIIFLLHFLDNKFLFLNCGSFKKSAIYAWNKKRDFLQRLMFVSILAQFYKVFQLFWPIF